MQQHIHHSKTNRFGQRGISLVEMAIAVSLVAGMVLAGAYWINRIELDQQLNNVRNEAVATMNAAIAAYATLPNTTGANPQVLSGLNIWPAERVTNVGTAAAQIQGHFKGSREFMWANTAAVGSLTAGSGFVYHITNVPTEVCAQLATGLASFPSTYRLYAGNYTADPVAGGFPAALTLLKATNTAALNMATLATACGTGNSRKHIAVVFFKV